MSFEPLHSFLTSTEIPHSEQRFGFLEIIGKQHHENINSAIYAHFINSDQPGIKDVFLEALLNLIHEKGQKQLHFSNAEAQTEVVTETGRIDILIVDRNRESAIIIENKIHHWLDNDLAEYWNYVKVDNDNKVGVLLTLEPHQIPEDVQDQYINLTHLEWIRSVQEVIDETKLSASYSIYLRDFTRTIESLTTTYEMNEEARFYFQHAEQVIKANGTMSAAHNFLQNQFQLIASEIGWKTYGNSLEWRNFWDEENHLDTYLTILTNDLLKGKMRYTLVLELFREDKKREDDLKILLQDHPQAKDKRRGEQTARYLHFMCKDYTITEQELATLSENVVANIRKDFADVTLLVIAELYPNVDISNWEKKFKGKGIEEQQ